MRKVDSFLKESQRLMGLGARTSFLLPFPPLLPSPPLYLRLSPSPHPSLHSLTRLIAPTESDRGER